MVLSSSSSFFWVVWYLNISPLSKQISSFNTFWNHSNCTCFFISVWIFVMQLRSSFWISSIFFLNCCSVKAKVVIFSYITIFLPLPPLTFRLPAQEFSYTISEFSREKNLWRSVDISDSLMTAFSNVYFYNNRMLIFSLIISYW